MAKRALVFQFVSFVNVNDDKVLNLSNSDHDLCLSGTHPSVVSDVVITNYLEKKWRESDEKDYDSIMWRYENFLEEWFKKS